VRVVQIEAGPIHEFVKHELGCRDYLRYVDDFALFGD
jgi:hypothetical protein